MRCPRRRGLRERIEAQVAGNGVFRGKPLADAVPNIGKRGVGRGKGKVTTQPQNTIVAGRGALPREDGEGMGGEGDGAAVNTMGVEGLAVFLWKEAEGRQRFGVARKGRGFGNEEGCVLEGEAFEGRGKGGKGVEVGGGVLGGLDAAGKAKGGELGAGRAVKGVEGPVGGDVKGLGVDAQRGGEAVEAVAGGEVGDFPKAVAGGEPGGEEGVEGRFFMAAGDEGKGEAEKG